MRLPDPELRSLDCVIEGFELYARCTAREAAALKAALDCTLLAAEAVGAAELVSGGPPEQPHQLAVDLEVGRG